MGMTREEAIAEIKYYMESDSYADAPSNEACKMAINALRPVSREQVEKMRGEWKRDKWPSGTHRIICNRCGEWNGKITNFCPRCGAPMTDEAVEMVMERMKELK